VAWPGILVVALVLQSDGGLGGCGCWDLEELFLGGGLAHSFADVAKAILCFEICSCWRKALQVALFCLMMANWDHDYLV
jgi:hypothetical protein